MQAFSILRLYVWILFWAKCKRVSNETFYAFPKKYISNILSLNIQSVFDHAYFTRASDKQKTTKLKKNILKYLVRCMIYSIQTRFAVFQKQTYFSIHSRCRQFVEINKPRIRFTFDAVVVSSLWENSVIPCDSLVVFVA